MVGQSNPATIKFLCSYGGKILPRYPDGKLRYHGGETRVLAVDRSIPFSELMLKMGEMYGGKSVILRCQLPKEDLDALVSITSDEDLTNLIEEYDRLASSPSLKIRALLSFPKSTKKAISPSSSSASSSKSSSSSPSSTPRFPCIPQISGTPVAFPLCSATGKNIPYCGYDVHHGNPCHAYLVHNRNHWQ
ncbi:octicosapeptide/Phox/Bem1p domain-containing family protein [Hibiscus syriacus]|uniref:Octicosapeptide/Phox/Bem1p domain-containing family protein n=1 Tax=Hibiscus syriacus TaxID=106335 RepID=A0A6A3B0N5_HIBSY|nr:uncharacterized protein LOC120117976 [Hibiscus syriacus]XP_038994055.1 uncharacterized protein LOC120117976 [Hibiscus syriacus]KAE8710221.1 octicosapeptide/Phox/Bem1p domain-containing family protein [Hibiscus syriacus]